MDAILMAADAACNIFGFLDVVDMWTLTRLPPLALIGGAMQKRATSVHLLVMNAARTDVRL